MRLQKRERLAVIACGAAVAIFALLRFAFFPAWDSLQETREAIPLQEKKLAKYREVVASAPLRTSETAKVEGLLRASESGLLAGSTATLASAELQDLVKQIAGTNSIDIRSSDFLPVKAYGNAYAEVPINLQFNCKIDQLASLMRDLTTNAKYVQIVRLTVQASNAKDKTIGVGMQVAGLMRAEPGQKKEAK